MNQSRKTRIAHLAGPTATIQNTPPLVTSNKARAKHGLPLLKDADGAPLRHDALRPQRLAAPAKVYVEQFSAHPLESDVAELYGPPDGYIGADGVFPKGTPERQRQAGLRDRAEAGRWLVPASLYGDPGRRIGVGGGMHLAGRAERPPGLFPRRLAQLRGNRSHVDRRRRHCQSAVLHCDDRFLPRRAAGRLHQGSAGASAQRQGRGGHPSGSSRHTLSSATSLITSPSRRRDRHSRRRPTTCRRWCRAATTMA